MKVLITGICGFIGSRLAVALGRAEPGIEITGFDNLMRPGSEGNRAELKAQGIHFVHGDLRVRSDSEALPSCDWVIDAAANTNVLAGLDGRSSSRQLAEHNLWGTINILEYCRERKAGLILLSSSRVYSIRDLAALPMRTKDHAFVLHAERPLSKGVSSAGLTKDFPTRPPVSLYGASKLCSETMALEYGSAFGLPVWINRCGVLTGAGQFGTAEQGIFSYWMHAHASRLPLRYIGFEGKGHQVRDAFHPDDLADLILTQMRRDPPTDPVYNVGGGLGNSMSLAQLTSWCDGRFGKHQPTADWTSRTFDVPWVVMDNSRVTAELQWVPRRTLQSILEEIADHAREHPDWLSRSGAR